MDPVEMAVPNVEQKSSQQNPLKIIRLQDIMSTSMPAFVVMAITMAFARLGIEELLPVNRTLISALPIVIAVITSRQVSGYNDIALIAGIISGALASNGGILSGILAGIFTGILVPYLVQYCSKLKIPVATTHLIAGGISGLAVGLIMYFLFSPLTLSMSDGIRWLVKESLEQNSILAGAVSGILMWPALIFGIYHSAILPIILLEVETVGYSFLGAIDSVGLGGAALGIALANFVFTRDKSDKVVVGPIIVMMILFGNFVETMYPFMFADRIVFFGALLASFLGGIVIGLFKVQGIGYMPLFLKPLMSNHPLAWIAALLVSTGVAFVATFVANSIWKRKQNATDS